MTGICVLSVESHLRGIWDLASIEILGLISLSDSCISASCEFVGGFALSCEHVTSGMEKSFKSVVAFFFFLNCKAFCNLAVILVVAGKFLLLFSLSSIVVVEITLNTNYINAPGSSIETADYFQSNFCFLLLTNSLLPVSCSIRKLVKKDDTSVTATALL